MGYDDRLLAATVDHKFASALEVYESMQDTHLHDVSIRVKSRVTVELNDHSFDHRGELALWNFLAMSLVGNLRIIYKFQT